MPSTHALQSAFKHVLKIMPAKWSSRGRDSSLSAHFFHAESQSFQLVNSFPFFFDVNIPCHAAANRLYTPPCLGSLSTGIKFSDARDVEQREIHAPFALAYFVLFQCSFDTLAAVAAD
jgi:hypothetical protein